MYIIIHFLFVNMRTIYHGDESCLQKMKGLMKKAKNKQNFM